MDFFVSQKKGIHNTYGILFIRFIQIKRRLNVYIIEVIDHI